MKQSAFRRATAILLALCLSFLAVAQSPQQPEDETAIRALLESYHSAVTKSDLNAALQHWSENSPEYANEKNVLSNNLFARLTNIQIKNVRFRQLKIEGERATALVTSEFSGNHASTGKPDDRMGKQTVSFGFVKQSGGWKITSKSGVEMKLAGKLIVAQSDAARAAMLAEDPELISLTLLNGLYSGGAYYLDRADLEKANQAFVTMQQLAEQLGSQSNLAMAINGLGTIQMWQGKTDEAMALYQRSVQVREKAGLKQYLPLPLINIAQLYQQQGNYSLAMEYLQKALPIAEAEGYQEQIANALNGIGLIHGLQYNFDLAMDYSKRGLAIAEKINAKAAISDSLLGLSNISAQAGNFAAALEYGQRNLKVSQESNDLPSITRALNSIGSIYSLQGNHAAALDYHQKALTANEKLNDQFTRATSLRQMAFAHQRLGNHEKAIEFGEQATALARQNGWLEDLSDALTAKAEAYRALKRTDEARRALDESITAIETLRRQIVGSEQEQQRFFEEKTSPYYSMINILAAQNLTEEALVYAERAKSRVLLDVLKNGKSRPAKSATSAEREQEKQLIEALASFNWKIEDENQKPKPNPKKLEELKAGLERARLAHRDFQAKLYSAHPELRVQRGEAQTLKLDEAATLLPGSDRALLEYVTADDTVYLFTLTKAAHGIELKSYLLPIKPTELAKLTSVYRQQLAGLDLKFRATAKRLYDVLLKPAQAQLAGKTKLIIVPDGKLWELPFQALITPKNQYLIESASVSYAPSLTVLREMQAQRTRLGKPSGELLAFGNPAFGQETVQRAILAYRDEKLVPLPEAEAEVKALGQLYGARSQVFVGADAREDRLKSAAATAGVLHIATHGVLNDAAPMYSHLALATNDEKEDGLLEAWELMQMDLKADLAVLSACETARGRIGAGEGVIGLSWALFVAGVPSTLVSQWKVESSSTRDLMLGFHRNLKGTNAKPGAPKAEALRQAVLPMLKKSATNHPFYWAGFVLVGAE